MWGVSKDGANVTLVEYGFKIDGKQLEMLTVRNQHGKSVGLTEDLRQRK